MGNDSKDTRQLGGAGPKKGTVDENTAEQDVVDDIEVDGIRCRQVLERFSDYLDGDLGPGKVAQIEGHLRGCNRCESFGGALATAVTNLGRELRNRPLEQDIADRLWARLEDEDHDAAS